MSKVLVPYHSTYEHIEAMIEAVTMGVKYQGRKIAETAIKLWG